MKNRRIHFGVQKKQPFTIVVDGEEIPACEGETVAAALLAEGRRVFRKTRKRESPRGLYCGVGQCQECKMTINDVPNVLACQTVASPGCKIETGMRRSDSEES